MLRLIKRRAQSLVRERALCKAVGVSNKPNQFMKLRENVKQMLAAGFQQRRPLCFCLFLVLFLSHCPLSFPAPDLHALGLNCLWLSSGTWTTILIQVVCFHLDAFPSLMWGVYVCASVYLHTCASGLGPGAAPALGLEQSHSAWSTHS